MSRIIQKEWTVRPSYFAVKTQNLIRNVVENIKMTPNPNKKYITLSIGDPTAFGNFQPPESVLQAIRDSLDHPSSPNYGPVIGFYEARKAVAEYSRRQGKVKPEDVILCSGCTHAIDLVITTLANSGQNILVPRPGHTVYKTAAEGLGIELKFYNLLPDQNWEIDLEDLENKIDEATALIVVINPSNPCGSVYKAEHLRDILQIASRNRVPVLADEIYEDFTFSGHKFTTLSSLSVDVPIITCSGITKRFLVPGWRLGWLIIHDRNNILGDDIRKGLCNVASRLLGPCVLIQRALPAILESPQGYFWDMMKFVETQANFACKQLCLCPGLRPITPQGVMYMMIEIQISLFPSFKDDVQFVERLLMEEAVLCLPGQCFGYPNFMRIVLTVPENILTEACNRIMAFCQQHCSGLKMKEELLDVTVAKPIIREDLLTTA
ncbi:tyrosine aminotransferase-like [Hyposmocoma kahamanoa]|uniref:tyrosine aminotransferase-like n=1 Tax=Hyposmocoma kahamanoa TaxID=1477025 RepID=UPI000E6DA565|nr:tyrosine aminotransferase-like [Hyposmocoma kahamanoa]